MIWGGRGNFGPTLLVCSLYFLVILEKGVRFFFLCTPTESFMVLPNIIVQIPYKTPIEMNFVSISFIHQVTLINFP